MKNPPKKKSHREHPQEDFYRLHIDESREPAPAKTKHQGGQGAHHSSLLESHHISKKKQEHGQHKSSGVAAWIWDKLQFVFVSAVVFAGIYVVLNWQALALNAAHFWNVWRGVKSPLEELVNAPPPPQELVAHISAPVTRATAPIPPLDIEIAPIDMRLVIPRINQNVPVVGVKNEYLIAREWNKLEADIQKALRNGVIHYPGTALPGDNGNIVITGHSSYYAWDPGRFKDVFALLHDVKVGDRVVMYFNQKKFIYEVEKTKVVLPKDVDVLGPTSREQLTLITCTPIGTNLKRLIVTAKLIEEL